MTQEIRGAAMGFAVWARKTAQKLLDKANEIEAKKKEQKKWKE